MNGALSNGMTALTGLNLLPHQMAGDPSVATANWIPQLPPQMVDPALYYGGGGHLNGVSGNGSGGGGVWNGGRTDSPGYEHDYDRFRGHLMQQS